MNATAKKLAMLTTLLAGVALWGGYAQRFNSEGKFEYEPNVACLKGSPYGKVLALAMQGSIDFYWHKGASHEHSEVLNAENGHHEGCPDGCDHDHASVAHDFQVEHEHGEGCGCPGHSGQAAVAGEGADPLRERAKRLIKEMAATAHRRTDNKPLSPAHEKYLQGVTEDKLRLAYELDPSNYTNYGNYHLFIATTNFGKEDADDAAAVALARRTLAYCKQDNVDPASWVTAASAAYNIVFHIGQHYQDFTIPEAKASLAEFDHCVQRYHELLEKAVAEGRIVSETRYREMAERIRYLGKLREAQGVYMKRVMSTKMASHSQPNPKQ